MDLSTARARFSPAASAVRARWQPIRDELQAIVEAAEAMVLRAEDLGYTAAGGTTHAARLAALAGRVRRQAGPHPDPADLPMILAINDAVVRFGAAVTSGLGLSPDGLEAIDEAIASIDHALRQ